MLNIAKRNRRPLRIGLKTIAIALSVVLYSFNSQAASGEELFNSYCASCHKTNAKRGVGPGLMGVTEKRDEAWLINWVKASQSMVNAGDQTAVELFKEYSNVPMPDFPQLSDEDIKSIFKYIDASNATAAGSGVAATGNSSGGAVATSDSGDGTGGSENSFTETQKTIIFWGVVVLIIVIIWASLYKRKIKEELLAQGYHGDPHKVENFPQIFIKYLVISAIIIFLLIKGLDENIGVINVIMFIVLPYVALSIFLIGSIRRYTNKGFQVSSLSSQFLEGKKLFWGSQPFHWGMLVLFLGHMVAFLFPRTLLAWNGEPIRLLILEVSSFVFALSALLGLILLMKRRLSTKMLLVVSNKMDMLVYTVLFVQILSGLGVAYYVRWGSSWFASVLTPYLRSVFSFNPDITAVAEMPWLIQIHIISAFFIIAIIPFTRFMHFLVAPIDYIWRKYQLVIWNWNRHAIRTSTRHTFGKKARNH
ncbi:MAG: respiratory nitrate reductase subunit gamma [Bacteroidia bacterium]